VRHLHGPDTTHNSDIPVLVVHSGLFHNLQVYPAGTGSAQPLPPAARIPAFAGARDTAYLLPPGHRTVYARIAPPGGGYGVPRFEVSTLDAFLREGASRARMITLAFGALAAMAVASLLIWVVLAERAFILYFSLFATVRLLLNTGETHDNVIYFGLPMSMVAAALLIALGIADRLRAQRRALSEAERHAQIDSLTGVLNRI
jgi:hypothetical protein